MRKLSRTANSAIVAAQFSGLLSTHPRIQERALSVQLADLRARVQHHLRVHVPNFQRLRQLRGRILARERERLRLAELQAKPMASFVRNQLINEVYLPLVGANLAKQIGAAGEDKRADLLGMLLLISPPGYGKTTLIEYIAQRLGLIFVKINCPTLGHRVISLDPAEAPNATARQELEKLNLALEMGNNVMLYLDDIQHAHAEFLQKFISLADAQRRVEGVWQSQPRTYDLRGKRFCMVMAGNPYTESGEMFKIPDMLANRADIYNLGDVLGGKQDLFALSYLENALTSNPTLAALANRDPGDTRRFFRLARGEEVADSEFAHAYTAAEQREMVAVLQKLFHIQSALLKVNQQYIASAAQADAYRVEPPFKLQGSYRNMNKLAEKVVAAMNDEELENLITDHYAGEAQTLTSGAEENLLKLAELRGILTPAQQQRWQEIKDGFARARTWGAAADADPATRVAGQISELAKYLQQIQHTLAQGANRLATAPAGTAGAPEWPAALAQLGQTLAQTAQAQASQRQAEWTQFAAAVKELALSRPQVEITNAFPPEILASVRQLVDFIDSSLLPVIQQFERQSRLDLVIWERLKEISATLRAWDRNAGAATSAPHAMPGGQPGE